MRFFKFNSARLHVLLQGQFVLFPSKEERGIVGMDDTMFKQVVRGLL